MDKIGPKKSLKLVSTKKNRFRFKIETVFRKNTKRLQPFIVAYVQENRDQLFWGVLESVKTTLTLFFFSFRKMPDIFS